MSFRMVKGRSARNHFLLTIWCRRLDCWIDYLRPCKVSMHTTHTLPHVHLNVLPYGKGSICTKSLFITPTLRGRSSKLINQICQSYEFHVITANTMMSPNAFLSRNGSYATHNCEHQFHSVSGISSIPEFSSAFQFIPQAALPMHPPSCPIHP